ncbi:MAG: SH3 domain-containing protein [Clostridia bacterium]|nr:SH3 domain-containing protein [Clostridia bacterium]
MHIFKKVALVAATTFIFASSCYAANGTVTTDALNIRSAPDTNSSILGKAYSGETLNVIGTEGSFYIVNYNGATAYTSKDFVSIDSGSSGTITTSGLNVREKPSSDSASVGKLNTGDTVKIVGSSGGWYEILLHGELRYVHSDYVKKGAAESAPAAASDTGSGETGYITTNGLNVRADASASATVIGKLNTGDTVEITGKSGSWYKISYSGNVGFVSAEYVSKTPGTVSEDMAETGTITTNGLNIRAEASASASVIGKLNTGDTVDVVGKSGSWYKISFSGNTGYISAEYVKITKAAAVTASAQPASGTGYITTDGLNVRSDASAVSSVIGKLNYGDKIEITGKSGDWYEISLSDRRGFVHGDYVTKGALPAKTKPMATTAATVITDGLNVRAAATSDAELVDKLYYGDPVKITGKSGEWYEISYSGKTGFVHGDYITTKDVSSSSAGNVSLSRAGGNIVDYSKNFIGVPYVSGGSSPSGFDCSGFTSYVFAHFGYSLPRTAAGQASVGTPVSKNELIPGDLVFFNTYGGISHVGIFTGGDSFIHATVPGDVVKIGSMSTAYYKRTYVTARRIIK